MASKLREDPPTYPGANSERPSQSSKPWIAFTASATGDLSVGAPDKVGRPSSNRRPSLFPFCLASYTYNSAPFWTDGLTLYGHVYPQSLATAPRAFVF